MKISVNNYMLYCINQGGAKINRDYPTFVCIYSFMAFFKCFLIHYLIFLSKQPPVLAATDITNLILQN